MPSGGLSVYFTIKDGASAVLSSIGDKTRALDKETQQLAQATQALSAHNKSLLESQTRLQSELTAAARKVKEAQKAYSEYGDELSKANLDTAIENQAALKQELTEVNSQLNSNKKTYNEYIETIRKGNVSSGGSSGTGAQTTLATMAKGLATGQIGQMAASALGDYLSQGLSSAIGVPEASLVSNTLSNAISGVAAGAIAGLPGMIIGGLVGAGSGMLSGHTEIQEAKDDAFKKYYAGLYEDVNAATEEMLSSGSVTAGSREQTLLAFAKRLGGRAAAENYLARVQDFAGETNYDYDEITGYSKLLMNSYDPNAVFGVLKSLSDATAGLSLSDSDVETMISGLNRMRTTGKATTEYLNFFSERGVDVYSALSGALGVDKNSIAEMVSGGEITGEFASQAILDYIDSTFGGLSEELMGTYDALGNNLEDIMTSIDAAGGESYNEMRKEGLEADIEAYGGALGEAMAEMNRIYGENAAYLENLSGQYQREALSAVLMGSETTLYSDEQKGQLEAMRVAYLEAKEAYENGDQAAGIRMQQEVENAEVLATAAYDSSDAAQDLASAERDQIAAIRENTAGLASATEAYLTSQEFSKGMGSTIVFMNAQGERTSGIMNSIGNAVMAGVFGYAYGLERVPYDNFPALLHEGEQVLTASEARSLRENQESYMLSYEGDLHEWPTADFVSHAYGLERVPYDDYPALLHEGERALTAADVRSQSEASVINISVTGNNFSGADSDMADRVAETIVRKLEQAAFVAAPR